MFAWILFYLLVLFVAAWSSPKSHKVFVGLHWIVCLAWCQVKQTIINFNPICIIPIRNSTTWSINGRDQFTNSFKFVRETLLKKVQLGELLIAQIFKLFWYPSLKPPSIHPINWKGFCFTTSTLQNHCMYSKCAFFLGIIYYIDKIQVRVAKKIVSKVDAKLIAIWRPFDKL